MSSARARRPAAAAGADVKAGRRRLLTSTLAAGVWTLGHAAQPTAQAQPAPGPAARQAGFSPWLQFAPDGSVTVLTNVAEMGQGTLSVIEQIAAEELDGVFASVRVQPAPLAPQFFNPFIDNYATFGVLGFRVSYAVLAPVCAAARHMLVAAAAQRWAVPADECSTADGDVRHAARVRRLPYAALLDAATALTPPDKPVLRPPRDWTVLGRSVPRADLQAKT
ncbi:MAG: molybdopterin cofactor-binding domain-containing protein, partial [Burkholderiales bacterium]